jgi:hypothetical protein
MFRTVLLPIIRSLLTVHSAIMYIIQVCRQLSSKTRFETVWHIPLLSVQWINSWWWTEELSETCRASCQNKFVKLVHLVGYIVKKLYLLIYLFYFLFICDVLKESFSSYKTLYCTIQDEYWMFWLEGLCENQRVLPNKLGALSLQWRHCVIITACSLNYNLKIT